LGVYTNRSSRRRRSARSDWSSRRCATLAVLSRHCRLHHADHELELCFRCRSESDVGALLETLVARVKPARANNVVLAPIGPQDRLFTGRRERAPLAELLGKEHDRPCRKAHPPIGSRSEGRDRVPTRRREPTPSVVKAQRSARRLRDRACGLRRLRIADRGWGCGGCGWRLRRCGAAQDSREEAVRVVGVRQDA
jgi:hypothetical protein